MTSHRLATVLLSLALSVFAAPSFAQSADGQVTLDTMRDRLALTPEQEAKIAPLLEERSAKLKALRSSSDPGASRREKLGLLRQARSIQQDFAKQVEPLLSKQQKIQWDALRKEMQEAVKERVRENRGG